MNLNAQLKKEYADKFYEIFMGKEQLFIKFLDMEVVNGVPESFPASWRYTKKRKIRYEGILI